MSVSIVTPWLGCAELIQNYELSVKGAQVVIVDNASDADTAVALDKMAERLGNGSLVIHNPENRYFTAANNQGYEQAAGAVVVFMNNDILAPHPWLDTAARDCIGSALVGPAVDVFNVDGEPCPYVEGWCVGASRETWERLRVEGTTGPWDSVNYVRCYGDDLDLSFRARLAGCQLLRSHWRVQHLGNYTNRNLPGAYDFAEANREKFREQVRAWKKRMAAP